MNLSGATWVCDQCGDKNSADTWPCDTCRYPLVHNAETKHVRGEYSDEYAERERRIVTEKRWLCSHCKFLNEESFHRCQKCFARKDANDSLSLQAKRSTTHLRRSMESTFPAFHTKKVQHQDFRAEELKEKIPVKEDKWKNISRR